MPTLTVTDARKNLFGLVDSVANEHRGYCIVGKRNQAVLLLRCFECGRITSRLYGEID